MTERNKTLALVGALVLVLATAGMLLAAELVGEPEDVDRLMLFVAGFAVPTITALLAAAGVRAELGGKIDQVHGKLDRQITERACRAWPVDETPAIGNGSHQPAVRPHEDEGTKK